jgi:pimeloyl-ACP methyl ester carboxylesterase
LDWADDVLAVADALCIDRFAVVGWSSGGAYALAVAAAIPDRLLGVGIVAGLAPIGVRPRGRFDRTFIFVARRMPLLMRAIGAIVACILGRIVARASSLRGAAHVVGEVDASVVAALGPQTLLPFREAFRSGSRGVVDDEVLVIEPWGIDLESIAPVVHLWQGGADRFALPAHARRLAACLPRAVLHEVPGEGHFLAYAHASEILDTLLPP